MFTRVSPHGDSIVRGLQKWTGHTAFTRMEGGYVSVVFNTAFSRTTGAGRIARRSVQVFSFHDPLTTRKPLVRGRFLVVQRIGRAPFLHRSKPVERCAARIGTPPVCPPRGTHRTVAFEVVRAPVSSTRTVTRPNACRAPRTMLRGSPPTPRTIAHHTAV